MNDAEKLHAIAAWLDDVEEDGAEWRDLRRLRRIVDGTMLPAEIVAARLSKAFADSAEATRVYLDAPTSMPK
jgi:hypothetical protein